MDRIAVLIPCYNEAPTIEKVIRDFQKVLPEACIYVYDNLSTDGTAQAAREAGAIVRYEGKQGKGNVVRRMFREIDAACYILVDGDDTYPAEAARKMAEAVLESGADMVVGDRLSSTYFQENKKRFHNAGNTFVRWSINYLFGADIVDIMTGYRALSFKFVKTCPVISEGFEVETEMSIHAADKNLAICNQIIQYRDRPAGSESKLNTYIDGYKVIRTIIRLFRTYRPMRFFGTLALVLLILGIGFLMPVLLEFRSTGEVARFPTLIVCGFAILAAMMSFFTGLQLETIAWKNRQDFERSLIKEEREYGKLAKAVIEVEK